MKHADLEVFGGDLPGDNAEITVENSRVVERLSQGTQGVVWTATVEGANGVPLVLKATLITSKMLPGVDRTLQFYTKIANAHPVQFSQLFDWRLEDLDAKTKKRLNFTAARAKRATKVLWTLSARKEGTLHQVYRTLSIPQWCSMISQVCKALSIMHRRGYSHNDIFDRNVAYIRIPNGEEAVDLIFDRGFRVPAYGYVWSLIDYDDVEYKSPKVALKAANRRSRRRIRASSEEIDNIIDLASGESDAENHCTVYGEKAQREDPIDSKGFHEKVLLRSHDASMIKTVMRRTGLEPNSAAALVNVDMFMWHLCREPHTEAVHPYLPPDALYHLSEESTTYSELARYFARRAVDEKEREVGRMKRMQRMDKKRSG